MAESTSSIEQPTTTTTRPAQESFVPNIRFHSEKGPSSTITSSIEGANGDPLLERKKCFLRQEYLASQAFLDLVEAFGERGHSIPPEWYGRIRKSRDCVKFYRNRFSPYDPKHARNPDDSRRFTSPLPKSYIRPTPGASRHASPNNSGDAVNTTSHIPPHNHPIVLGSPTFTVPIQFSPSVHRGDAEERQIGYRSCNQESNATSKGAVPAEKRLENALHTLITHLEQISQAESQAKAWHSHIKQLLCRNVAYSNASWNAEKFGDILKRVEQYHSFLGGSSAQSQPQQPRCCSGNRGHTTGLDPIQGIQKESSEVNPPEQ